VPWGPCACTQHCHSQMPISSWRVTGAPSLSFTCYYLTLLFTVFNFSSPSHSHTSILRKSMGWGQNSLLLCGHNKVDWLSQQFPMKLYSMQSTVTWMDLFNRHLLSPPLCWAHDLTASSQHPCKVGWRGQKLSWGPWTRVTWLVHSIREDWACVSWVFPVSSAGSQIYL
jgi:hypothetical protein